MGQRSRDIQLGGHVPGEDTAAADQGAEGNCRTIPLRRRGKKNCFRGKGAACSSVPSDDPASVRHQKGLGDLSNEERFFA